MLGEFRTRFNEIFGGNSRITANPKDLNRHQRQLVSAALMIEVASIDQDFSSEELFALKDIIQREYQLNNAETENIIQLAQHKRDDASSLYPFTKCVNDQFSPSEKYQLLLSMWKVAFADGYLDKHEKSIIRRIADLIYVPHSEFIRAKLQAKTPEE